MNILFFPTRFFPAISGGDFYLQRLGKELKRLRDSKNNSVFFLTTDAIDFAALRGSGRTVPESHRYYKKYHNLLIKRLKVKNIKNTDSLILQKLCSKLLGFTPEISKNIIKNGPILAELDEFLLSGNKEKFFKHKPDIIHCSYLPYSNLLYSLLLAKIYDIPSVVTPFFHSANVRYQNKNIFEILKTFDAIIACTPNEKKIFISNGIEESKVHILPMGVDINRFQKDYRDIFKKIYSVQSPILLFCGYKNYEKGALTILKTIPLLTKDKYNVTVVFIGPSTKAFNYNLTALKKKNLSVTIINISPENLSGIFDPKKIGAFQSTDIFCMPSRSDAYGIAYLEAWACKKPVIGAEYPVMHDIIRNKKDGLLVEFDNPYALKNAICSLLDNPKKRKELGNNGFLKISKYNQWNDIARRTLQIYEKLLDKGD